MEIAAAFLYKAKLIRSFCHLYGSQEAIAVGMEAALTKVDRVERSSSACELEEGLPLSPPAYLAAAVHSLGSTGGDPSAASAIAAFLSMLVPLIQEGELCTAKAKDTISIQLQVPLMHYLLLAGDGCSQRDKQRSSKMVSQVLLPTSQHCLKKKNSTGSFLEASYAAKYKVDSYSD